MTEEEASKFTTKRRSIGSDGELKWGGDDGEQWSEAMESSENIKINDDGTISTVSDIPGSVVLDDWEDGNLTSNREDFNSLEYQPNTENKFNPAGTRPDWNIDKGSASVSNGQLTFNSQSSAISTPDTNFTPQDGEDVLTWWWEWTFEGSNGRLSAIFLHQDDGYNTGWNLDPNNGYYCRIEPDGYMRLSRVENGSGHNLADANWPGDQGTYQAAVTVDDSGNFELYVEGELKDSATDTMYIEEDKHSVALGTGSQGSDGRFNWFVEF